MENATKALLIAAAILVTIIIISLGIFVVTQGQEAMAGVDMSEAEAAQFNAPFKAYEGSNKSTAQVHALLNKVLSHNKQEAAAGTNRFVKVTVTKDGETVSTLNSDGKATDTAITRISGSEYYTITCSMTGTIVNEITVTDGDEVKKPE